MKTAIIAVIAVIILVAFSCSNEGGGFFAKLLKGGGSAVPVTVESVVTEERPLQLKVSAVLEPSESVDITSPEDATIERLMTSDGAIVNAGDPLVRVSAQDTASKVAHLRSELKDAQNTLDKNSYLLRNRDKLLEDGRIEKNVYDSLESDVSANEAAVEKIQFDINRAEEKAISSTLTSSISGVVSRINGSVGSTIPASKPIMTITKSDPILATFQLPEQNTTAVQNGMTINVKFPELGGESVASRVTSIGTTIDPTRNTFQVKSTIANPTGRFKAGMRAEAEFTSSEKQRFFLIPEEALIKERHAYFVFTVAKGVAHKVQVIPNETKGNKVEITRGLGEDDIVVVKGNDKLTENTVVDIWGK